MGSCVSRSPAASAAVEFGQVVATAKLMDLDGSMAQFSGPVTAHEALGDERRRASCFVCSSDELYFDAPARALAAEEALQAGQLYFVLPLSMLRRPLSGQDMAELAVKACAALAVDVDRTAGASSSQRKNGGDKQRRQMARVAPLLVVSSNEGEQDSEWNYHVYDKYGNQKTVHGGDQTVGKTRKAAGYRSGGARHRAAVQRLSAILEASE